ncbi:MAG: hypothetical protein NTU47_12880 [Ignavibacteriales bacterium]|nr:hypothetical protein [Ignavibacteriales bacterium]
MKPALLAVLALVLFSSCTSTYPYIVTTDECNCERFVYKDERGRFEIDLSAHYVITDRFNSTIGFVFRNKSLDPLNLQQAYLKGTSVNVRYPFNDRFQPMPYVVVSPGSSYTMTLQGSDTETTGNPWLKIAGETIVIEIKGMLLGPRPLAPIVLALKPYNPKLTP